MDNGRKSSIIVKILSDPLGVFYSGEEMHTLMYLLSILDLIIEFL